MTHRPGPSRGEAPAGSTTSPALGPAPEVDPVPVKEQPGRAGPPPAGARRERKAVLLRLDPAVHEALAHWAADDLRSLNGHVEWILRRALTDAGRSPKGAGRSSNDSASAPNDAAPSPEGRGTPPEQRA